MGRTTVIALTFALAALPSAAQLRVPRPSPKATVTQAIGLTDVTLSYSRPAVKGRTIFGGLVPYDKVWRTGANEATTIAFTNDVTIEGKPLPKGSYSIHTIPGKDEWTVIFNSVADQWGSYSYDESKDVVRARVKARKAPFTESLTLDFQDVTTDTAALVIRWADVAVPVTINAHTTAKVMAAARDAVAAAKGDDWRTPYDAAAFAFDNRLDADAAKWLDASLKANENLTNLYLKARMLERSGRKAEAIQTAEQALAKKTDRDNANFAGEIRKSIENWKK